MKRSILIYINKLQAYKTAIKNIHWSSNNMSEHKLFDDIEDAVAEFYDLYERGANREDDLAKSIPWAQEIYNQFANSSGSGKGKKINASEFFSKRTLLFEVLTTFIYFLKLSEMTVLFLKSETLTALLVIKLVTRSISKSIASSISRHSLVYLSGE